MNENPYYNPDRLGLETVGDVEWSGEPWEFDLTIVRRSTADGSYYVWHDTGCSCPEPFERATLANADLHTDSAHDVAQLLQDKLAERLSDTYKPAEDPSMNVAGLIASLMAAS